MARMPALAEVNITPLVDVMLVVLALFMITAPALVVGPRVSLPEVTAPATSLDSAEAVVSVSADGRVFYGDRLVQDDLVALLRGDARLREQGQLYVRGDRHVRFEQVARVLDAARVARVSAVHLVVDPLLLVDVENARGGP